MEWMIAQVNMVGRVFVELALPMLLTSTVLAGLILPVEFLLRARVRAGPRYGLVLCFLLYLVLTPLLSLSPPSTHWPSGAAAYGQGLLPATHRSGTSNLIPASACQPAAVPGGFPPVTALRVPPAWGGSPVAPVGAGERSCTLSWQGAVFLLWLIGATVLGGVLTGRALAACRRMDRTRAANDLMNDILVYCRTRMGIRSPIRLRVGEEGTAPVVCGLINPVIVVPRNLATTLGSRHLRDVLFHELAHLKQHDLWINFAQNILQVVYFYNPLLLVINAVLRRLREEVANETVLNTIGDADHAYTRRLADVALLAAKPPASSLRLIAVA